MYICICAMLRTRHGTLSRACPLSGSPLSPISQHKMSELSSQIRCLEIKWFGPQKSIFLGTYCLVYILLLERSQFYKKKYCMCIQLYVFFRLTRSYS